MPVDLTLCPGEHCPQRERCYRFRAVPDARQDWFGSAPYDPRAGRCELFMDLAARVPSEDAVRTAAYYLWLAEGKPEGRADALWARAKASLSAAYLGPLRPEGEPEP